MNLDDEHRVGSVGETEELDTVEEEIEYEVKCYKCLEEARQNDWSTEVESSNINEDSVEYWVRCSGCHREIEFGWSHPDGGGRIWPVNAQIPIHGRVGLNPAIMTSGWSADGSGQI